MEPDDGEVLAKRLRRARLSQGMTQAEVAEDLDVSSSYISRCERGEVSVDSTFLLDLAKVLDVHPESLLRPGFIEVTTPDFRKKSTLRKREQDAVVAKVGEWIERYLQLEEIVGASTTFDVESHEVDSMEEIEEAAESLREEWGLGLDPIDNLTEVLEDQGVRVCPVAGSEDLDALAFRVKEGTPVIAVREGVPGDRQRFSMAHELGHLVLEPKNLDPEDAANRFAGAWLVPRESAVSELGESRDQLNPHELHLLKHKYGLSMAGWVYRARDLGIVTEEGAERMWRYFSSKGWRQEEPGELFEPEEPTRMKRLVLRALQEDLVSPSRAAELVGMSLNEFQEAEARRHAGFPDALRV